MSTGTDSTISYQNTFRRHNFVVLWWPIYLWNTQECNHKKGLPVSVAGIVYWQIQNQDIEAGNDNWLQTSTSLKNRLHYIPVNKGTCYRREHSPYLFPGKPPTRQHYVKAVYRERRCLLLRAVASFYNLLSHAGS